MEGVTIILDKKELVFLAALLDEELILGVEDPFFGWLAEQVEEEWKRFSAEMLKNGLITAADHGGYAVSAEIADSIRLCCAPDIWVSVIFNNPKGEKSSLVLNLGITNKQAVKISPGREYGTVEFCYGTYEQKESMEIADALSISSNFENSGSGFDIPERTFKALSDVSIEESLAQLKDILSDDKPAAECFIKALRSPMAKSLINIGSMNADSSGMTSFVLIEGENCLWRVEYSDERGSMVRIRSSDWADCIDKLESIMKQGG